MKKTLLLTLATGLACAMPTMAEQFDLYITGATAFRTSVHDAAKDLFDVPPATNVVQNLGTLQYGYSAYGGSGALKNDNTQWYMRGTASNAVPALGTNELVIHALFNGSVQGIKNVVNKDKLYFLKGDGSIITNTPTIAFSDVPSSATPYTTSATADFDEDKVAVQPFVWARAMAGNALMTNVNNISYEQAKYFITAGRAKLSAWTMNPSHTNLVYLLGRTKDSGTRRLMLACNGYSYNTGLIMYNYDATANQYYSALDNGSNNATGLNPYGVIGAAGVDNVNMAWGPGYIGGGDCRTALNIANANNYSIAYMSFADAKSAGLASSNWSAVIPFNGVYPTIGTNGQCLKDDKTTPWLWGNGTTNNFSPITSGLYSGWAYEMMVYPINDPSAISADQNLTFSILGDANTPDTILGIFNKKYSASATPGKGSIEKQIEASKAGGATAIRIGDMKASRAAVGAVITP